MNNNIFILSASDREVDGSLGIGAESPVWGHVEMRTRRAFRFGGSVRLTEGSIDTDTRIKLGISLGMESHPCAYRLIYSPLHVPGEKIIHWEWWEPGDIPFRGTTVFNDHPFDDRTVCRDVHVALNMFKDFLCIAILRKKVVNVCGRTGVRSRGERTALRRRSHRLIVASP